MESLTQLTQNPWLMWPAVAVYAFVGVTLLSSDRPEMPTRIAGGAIVLLEGVGIIARILS